jgi:hypothetical protein
VELGKGCLCPIFGQALVKFKGGQIPASTGGGGLRVSLRFQTSKGK